MQNNDLVGRLVFSKAGRDKDKPYIVVSVLDDNYVALANGSTKLSEMPKKKRLKHLNLTDILDRTLEKEIISKDKSLDLKIKRFIKLEGIDKEV
ncbi:KOW domain-containing RNA-binding protein [Clostridium sp. YIM B02551]|uniref:KOW domain-containing RNA-binding protein n=1 Tax=Clostridium sp. YIM B02551 TaxID=2910679 RepID=UPI001EEA4625|nr:KOW domain-containing RNA-binding protein [Clostridium sp. YIM B02551]